MKDYQVKFYTFFGIKPPQTAINAIITNINPLYNAIKESGKVIEEGFGFYQSAFLSFGDNSASYLLVKITPGSPIFDVTRLLAQISEKLLLFGIAGALTESLNIGDVIRPTVFKKNNFHDIVLDSHEFSVFQTTGLIQENDYYKELINEGVGLVDMESYDFMMECKKANIIGSCVFQISDHPLTEPFYNAKSKDFDVEQFLKFGGIK